MKQANTDTTYCCKECENKCWRHQDNFEFDPNTNYWFTNECIEGGTENAR